MVLRTLEFGWATARSAVDASAGELVITEALRREMRASLAAGRLSWYRQLEVLDGTESWSVPGLSRPDGIFDIPIMFGTIRDRLGDHQPHAVVECKRIAATDAALVRLYVIEGIDRFCSGQYAAEHSAGFMAGYVVASTDSAAVAAVNSILKKRSRSSEQLEPYGIKPTGPFWQSEHPRTTDPMIRLHHTMLSYG